jgi:AraC family transcriptional regulator, regulatory protein of adaptative response / DNA-3-methyladenine glycosylase II
MLGRGWDIRRPNPASLMVAATGKLRGMLQDVGRSPLPPRDICERALDARDPRFDGIFFVGITSTRVYCRPTCPARVAYTDRRRFFESAASAERAGFRPCLRCRPELAPGWAPMDAVPRLARVAADRIGAGALNGHSVAELAHELGVSERHLRRALEREIGVSPLELAQTHRLLFAKRLLADTSLSVTRIAFASGFQSLRRFNSVFRERYRLSPGALRRPERRRGTRRTARTLGAALSNERVALTLAYRPPLAWSPLIALLDRDALPGVELIQGRRYARTVCLEGRSGVIVAEDAAWQGNGSGRVHKCHLNTWVSASLLPALMPLLARLRRLFDLDAEPTVVDAHLEQGGLGHLVRRHPGIRIPGALDGFEAAFRVLLREETTAGAVPNQIAMNVVRALGEPLDTGIPGLSHLAPSAARVAEAGAAWLTASGVAVRRAAAIVAIARASADGTLRWQPGSDAAALRRTLREIAGIEDRLATMIVMRGLHWPDAFPAADPALQHALGATSEHGLHSLAETWRPWRGYAALHLWLYHERNGAHP